MTKKTAANFISILFNPGIATFATVALALAATQTGSRRIWLLLLIALNLLIPLILVVALIKQGLSIDDTLSNNRVKRERLYAIGPLVTIGLIEWWFARWQANPQPITAAIAATTSLTAIVGIISYGWKISYHMANISAFVFAAGLILGLPALISILLLPLVAWARLNLERHTAKQLIGGTLLSPLVIIPVFYLYGLI